MTQHDPGPAFRALHKPGDPFILANAWDIGSAKVLHALGAQAIATTSAGHAFTIGKTDGGAVSRDEALAHAEDLVRATPLPVSGDFENGYGEAPEVVAETVRLACEAGLAGCSIEDTALPDDGPYDFDLAVERIRAACAARDTLPRDFVLVARADGCMLRSYDTDEAIWRLKAFEEAGADCLYAPLPRSAEDLGKICQAIAAPVNALAAGPKYASLSRAEFAALGVARISVGSALASVTQKALLDAAGPMVAGDFTGLLNGARGDVIDEMMGS
ncbi:MAG: isocitrate lyase/phosphoenolpyruvate mutase family protein [Pseudomonadota bacterium]